MKRRGFLIALASAIAAPVVNRFRAKPTGHVSYSFDEEAIKRNGVSIESDHDLFVELDRLYKKDLDAMDSGWKKQLTVENT